MSEQIALNVNCMDFMATLPDKSFSLAICDPPYGISITDSGRLSKWCANDKRWDDATPDDAYFKELFRVSENQIIWGGQLLPFTTDSRLYYMGQAAAGKCIVCKL